MIARAPVVVLFFADTTAHDLSTALDEIAEQFQLTSADKVEWFFPDSDRWRLAVRFEDGIPGEFTDEHREAIRAEVGAQPSAILSLTLNWRAIPQACDAAKTLVLHLLSKFYGIAHDGCGKDSIWNINQIRSSKRGAAFLDCYH